MRCQILHEGPGRIRAHLCGPRMDARRADEVEAFLERLPFVRSARAYQRTGDITVLFDGDRRPLLDALAHFHYGDAEAYLTSHSARALRQEYQDRMIVMVGARLCRRLFLPMPLRTAWIVWQSLPYLGRGLRCLLRREIRVELLDALSVGVSMLRGDFSTAESVMFLLGLGALLEEWTHKRSVDDLARSMSLNVDKVWQVTDGGDVLVPIQDLRPGDRIRVRAGSLIPVDGRVVSGEAMVDQASLTGESVAVAKRPGTTVYAGTALEEGECVLETVSGSGSSRYDRIVAMIEETERLSSATERQASRLADRLVPFSLLGTALTYLLTRDARRAVSILMVDFSCALKLSMPLSFLSAMSEAGRRHITVKSGRSLEAAAHADTIVFDKTGTLTRACPTVVDVVPFGGRDPQEMLRLAACLEEHFPHSIANAVVRRAQELGLDHHKMHAEVEYLVAHGIASAVEGERAVIGSYHFVFEDEGCTIPDGERDRFDALPPEWSHLYLAIGGELAAAICVADPLRPEARDVLARLRELGVRRLVMMTGDSARTAAAIAAQVGVDAWEAEVLPEDKAAYIRSEHEAGRTVLMVGDGINDAPALSAADAGIAISDGAAIAREIADITIVSDDLRALADLRALSLALMRRVDRNYRIVMGFNGGLIALGALGLLPPSASALLHNTSTLLTGIRSMGRLLEDEDLMSPAAADIIDPPV